MKRKRLACVLAVGVIVIFLVVILRRDHRIGEGKSWPAGKLVPQLSQAWSAAALLAPDGSIWVWGNTPQQKPIVPGEPISEIPQRIGNDSDWTAVACGTAFLLALKSDGTLWSLDKDRIRRGFVQIGTNTNWAQISTQFGHCLAMQKDRSLWGWGYNGDGELGDGTKMNRREPALISTVNYGRGDGDLARRKSADSGKRPMDFWLLLSGKRQG